MVARFGAVVVAAGLSSRMQDFKQLMHIGNASITELVVRSLFGFGASPIVSVIGYRAEELRPILESAGATCVFNPNYASTEMFDSIKIGFKEINGECDRIFLAPADVPLFAESDLETIARIEARVVIPSYAGKGGHPVLVDSSLVPQLLEYPGDNGLKGFFRSLPEGNVAYAEVDNEGVLLDADYPDDFKRIASFYRTRQ